MKTSRPRPPVVTGTPDLANTGSALLAESTAKGDRYDATSTTGVNNSGTVQTHLYQLTENYPHGVSIENAVEGLSSEDLATLAQAVCRATGIALPDDALQRMKAGVLSLTDALAITPSGLQAAATARNALLQNSNASAAPQYALPNSFSFSNFETLSAENAVRPQAQMAKLAANIYSGDIQSSVPDADIQRNVAMAEILERLADNLHRAPQEKFAVKVGTQNCDSLDSFLKALENAGHTVKVSFVKRVANFANLKQLNSAGHYVDIPAPVMVKTGIHNIAIPALHSEARISISQAGNPNAPLAIVNSFQGAGKTGFFPADAFETPVWCGRKESAVETGDKARKAVVAAGAFVELIQRVAEDNQLINDGYGIAGVCNDFVAVIETLTHGATAAFPLLMNDSLLEKALKNETSLLFQDISKAIKKLPSDTEVNATSAARVLESLCVWPDGEEPFVWVPQEKKLLQPNA